MYYLLITISGSALRPQCGVCQSKRDVSDNGHCIIIMSSALYNVYFDVCV